MSEINNVVVCDTEFNNAGKKIEEYCAELIRRADAYKKEMEWIISVAVKDELISGKLQTLADEVGAVIPFLEKVKEDASKECYSFVTDIDKADEFLYGGD